MNAANAQTAKCLLGLHHKLHCGIQKVVFVITMDVLKEWKFYEIPLIPSLL
jgi:hypothetical protein